MRRAPRRPAGRKASPSARLRHHRLGEPRTMALSARRNDGQGSKHGLDGTTQSMTRDGKIGVALRGWRLALGLFIAAILSVCGVCHAAGSASGTAPPAAGADPASFGVTCSIAARVWAPAEDLPWASVWLGHFSGGRGFEGGSGQIFIDWRDDKLCFPSRQKCQAWIAGLRRAYRRPEGFWTCLLLR
jgi:hypothetical protein